VDCIDKAQDGIFHLMNTLRNLRISQVTNRNLIQDEIKGRLNSGNACYHSVQSLLSSRLLSKNLKIRIYEYKTIILSVVLYGCETWSLTLREEHRLRVF
jgi:t-SNARE complex subunit (syntaxin)